MLRDLKKEKLTHSWMMALSKEFLLAEIKKSQAALKAIQEGKDINELILEAFKEELSKLK